MLVACDIPPLEILVFLLEGVPYTYLPEEACEDGFLVETW